MSSPGSSVLGLRRPWSMQVSIPKFTNIGVLVPSAPARIIAYDASVAIS